MVPLLFNIYNTCDIFFDITGSDIASYAYDNTPYNFNFNLDSVLSTLEKSFYSIVNWFRENHMKASPDKCHVLGSSNENWQLRLKIFVLKRAPKKNRSNLSFENNFTSQKLYALARISHYMDLNKRRNLMQAFITSQFSYCPLMQMFHSLTQ